MNKNRMILATLFLLAEAVWLQRGGIGMGSLLTAEDITLRQATCEIVSMISLVGAGILFALLPAKNAADDIERGEQRDSSEGKP
jgi:hypothetical protein